MSSTAPVDAYEIHTADGLVTDLVCFECARQWILENTGLTLEDGEPFDHDGYSASWRWPGECGDDHDHKCQCGKLLDA